MQDAKIFAPNWKTYLLLLTAFSLLSLSFYGLLEMSFIGFLLLVLLEIGVLAYLLINQNKLTLSSEEIHQSFLLPIHSDNAIEIGNIDWIALDNRAVRLFNLKLFCRSDVIIKLKNNQVVTINLSRLNQKEILEKHFLNLCNQMADHDAELFKIKDLHGFSQLAIDATLGLTGLVEAMHQNITRFPGMSGNQQESQMLSATHTVYKNIRAITGLAGGGIDGLLTQLTPLLSKNTSNKKDNTSVKQKNVSLERAALLSALNGVLGDYMMTTNNAMTIPMRLRRNGRSLKLSSDSLSKEIQPISGKLLVIVHGLCMNDFQWDRKGHNHAESLTQDLAYTPVYLRYNTGQHISSNGRAFSELLEVLVKLWPVAIKDMVIVGHSMGGLVTRSAFHYGQLSEYHWVHKVQKIIFLGSPHHGAPLERGGNWVDTILGSTPYTAPLARLGKIRSSGITDLRYGNIIDEHWQGKDRFERAQDNRLPVPLPKEIKCFAIAGTVGNRIGDVRDNLLGDGLVQVDSALGKHKDSNLCLNIPTERQWIAYGVNHMDLLCNQEVYTQIKRWLS